MRGFDWRTSTAALAVATALLLAACGGDGGGTTTTGGPAGAVRTALETTTAPSRTATTPPAATGTGTTGAAGAAVLAVGRNTFDSNGCGSCHTLAAAGASGTIGPDLDQVLPGRSAAFIHESIVNPDAEITPGFSAGVMPSDFGDRIPRAQLAALVTFLRTQAGR